MNSVSRILFLFAFLSAQTIITKATTYTIQVSDFEFTQDFDTVIVGDTVRWIWINGTHTTTSNGIPEGAQPWSEQLDQFHTSFTYVVKFGGEYNYISVPDAPLMGESFISVYPVGILPVTIPASNFNLVRNPTRDKIECSFSLTNSAVADISLFNLAGTRIQTLAVQTFPAGISHQAFSLKKNIVPGLYFVSLRVGDAMLTRKVIIQ